MPVAMGRLCSVEFGPGARSDITGPKDPGEAVFPLERSINGMDLHRRAGFLNAFFEDKPSELFVARIGHGNY